MATTQSTADFLTAQASQAGIVRNRKMFGEYALYCDEKVVALICDDKLFVKPTDAGRNFAEQPEEAPPYPGSKPFLLIEEDRWEDRTWLSELIRITAEALPAPKPKKKKKK
ncbi:MAG: TfoX/Sxy family protein [Candidatus Peribacteraceae bacterium]|nr:TfoX/Sxy family protein [Candidatus Peribacteraceae bacterium]MBP9850570.1 TfoX/Sxy family protein [Candidatus Peribacteraceae bacterium]